jgi:hypothetical protein
MTSESDNEPNNNNHNITNNNQTTTEAKGKENLKPNSRNTRYTRILTTPPSSQILITPTPAISTASTLKSSPVTPKTTPTTQNSHKIHEHRH